MIDPQIEEAVLAVVRDMLTDPSCRVSYSVGINDNPPDPIWTHFIPNNRLTVRLVRSHQIFEIEAYVNRVQV